MLRNKMDRNANGMPVSGSAAGTNPEGKSCEVSPGNKKPKCDEKSCDKPKTPKYLNPQWLCYEGIREVVDYIREKTQILPQVAILCGKNIDGIVDKLDSKVVFTYEELPHFHVLAGKASAQLLTIGKLGRNRILVMQGRFPPYEGFHYGISAMPVRVARMLGCTHFINANTVSSLNKDFGVGDMVIIKDHVNFPGLCGLHPLKGPNDDRLGPRFPDLTCVYDREMRQILKETFASADAEVPLPAVKEGIMALVSGPAFLTPAEVNVMKTLGIDVISMSGAHENIVAKHQGFKVLQVSVVGRICSMDRNVVPEEPANMDGLITEQRANLFAEFIKNLDLI